MLIGFILNIVFNLTLRFLYVLENKKRDRALEGKSEEEIESLRNESRIQGFENVTDKQNVSCKWHMLVPDTDIDITRSCFATSSKKSTT